MGIFGSGRGKGRKTLLQYHRLYQFEETWDRYLRGEVTAEYVSTRARAMLRCGLPERLK